MDKAYRASDRVEASAMDRVAKIYSGALETALKEKKGFFQKVVDVYTGKYPPPAGYTEEMAKAWREGFITELMRQQNLINDIADALAKAGVAVQPVIKDAMAEIYGINRKFTVGKIEGKAQKAGLEVYFNQYDKRQIDILLRETQTPFSKIAYHNLGNDRIIVRRLTTEMAQAVILGESRSKIVKRIQKVTGQSLYQAQRVVQTERTRVQSQARFEAGEEARVQGLNIVKRWSARMIRTRDTHAELDGTEVPVDKPFVSPSGAELMYPGAPGAPAAEVINCQCVMETDVRVGKAVQHQGYLGAKQNNGHPRSSQPIDYRGIVPTQGTASFSDGTSSSQGGRVKQANVYTLPSGQQIRFPKGYNKSRQGITPEQALRLVDQLPAVLRDNVRTVDFVDYYNPMDTYWRKKYKNFGHSYATGGPTGITFYRNDRVLNTDENIFESLLHETGHVLDASALPGKARISQGKEYLDAIAKDTIISGKKAVTPYAENSIAEDFAESVKLYSLDQIHFEEEFPQRAALLRRWIP